MARKNVIKYMSILILLSSFCFSNCSHEGGTATVTINLGFPGHESAHNRSFIDRLLGLFLEKAYAQPPTDIESFLVRVTGPGMGTLEYGFAPTATTISVVVPAGKSRTISVIALVSPASESAALSFTGAATMDLNPGDMKSISVTMIVSETKIVIPDYSNNRIVQIDDMDGNGWTSLNTIGAMIIRPYDIDFDSRGRIYFANNDFTDHFVIRIDDISGSNPLFISQGTIDAVTSLTVDRNNNLVYFSDGTDFAKSNLDGTSTAALAKTGVETIGTIYGMAIAENGIMYITGITSLGSPRIFKYDPVAESVTATYGPTNLASTPWDVLVKKDYIYIANNAGADGYKILQFDTDLQLIGNFGVYSLTNPETPGNFYGPRRFVAILNRKITIIDDSSSGNYDKLVSIDDITGANWEYFGSSGSGVGYFNFYDVC